MAQARTKDVDLAATAHCFSPIAGVSWSPHATMRRSGCGEHHVSTSHEALRPGPLHDAAVRLQRTNGVSPHHVEEGHWQRGWRSGKVWSGVLKGEFTEQADNLRLWKPVHQ
eukprot:CAMPEP_0178432654 /NCGR_PEP_ID=MMETSP0689_2-20121128/32500_1 /TAXON_ID=160604 /ORGANISM="Amphidinium massartii, Strain CS-259" /LENGTH=110 /DNA_ID=CAMNT_0020054655 /DNA_START=185 /DNA_END=517 /DNA_ORIENTATION=+